MQLSQIPGAVRWACVLLLTSWALSARLSDPGVIMDLNSYLAEAPIVVRAEIVSISSPRLMFGKTLATAQFRVTRWYRGQPPAALAFRFDVGRLQMNGEICPIFKPGTHWLLLARERDGALELIDECNGAFRVTPELGAAQPDPIAGVEADFLAGLASATSSHRLLNLERLANLRRPSSLPALRGMISHGSPLEVRWALCAALRAGDVSLIPFAHSLLQAPLPDPLGPRIHFAIRELRDPAAIPALTEIAWSQSDAAKASAISALGNIPSATSALPAITANLNSGNEAIRRAARRAIAQLTHTSEPQ